MAPSLRDFDPERFFSASGTALDPEVHSHGRDNEHKISSIPKLEQQLNPELERQIVHLERGLPGLEQTVNGYKQMLGTVVQMEGRSRMKALAGLRDRFMADIELEDLNSLLNRLIRVDSNIENLKRTYGNNERLENAQSQIDALRSTLVSIETSIRDLEQGLAA